MSKKNLDSTIDWVTLEIQAGNLPKRKGGKRSGAGRPSKWLERDQQGNIKPMEKPPQLVHYKMPVELVNLFNQVRDKHTYDEIVKIFQSLIKDA